MAKIRAAYGDWVSNEFGAGGKVIDPSAEVNDTGGSNARMTFAIPNRCRVRGVYLFNSEESEEEIRLIDANAPNCPNYAAVQSLPRVYATVVPRDSAFSHRWTLAEVFDIDLKFDIYDTPSGVYNKFPKPGFLFENGVGVLYFGTDASPQIHWLIFYSE